MSVLNVLRPATSRKVSMKVCIIKPPILHKGVSFARFATPPLGMAYIAGAIRQAGHDVQVIDASAQGIDSVEKFSEGIYLFGLNKEQVNALIDDGTEVICLSLMFTNNWLYDRELIDHLKATRPNATVIAGGEHPTAMPKLCLSQSALDCIVMGEGEETVIELLDALSTGVPPANVAGVAYKGSDGIRINGRRSRARHIEGIAPPAWDLFPLGAYFDNRMTYGVWRGRTLPVMATRGCPYECTFCSSPQMWGRTYEMRPPDDFVNELEHLYHTYNVENFELYDLTAIIKKQWIVDMCREILRRGLHITYQFPSGTRAEAIDSEVAVLLRDSGCKNITYAPESGSKKVLAEVKKKVKIERMLDSIRQSSRAGLNVKLNMVMGFPDDTHSDIWRTFWFLIRCSWNGANDAAPAVFSPYPGSALFDRLVSEGRIDADDDSFMYDLIGTYDLIPRRTYSNHISRLSLSCYIFLFLFLFYGSNYLFRPLRLLRTVRNVILGCEESKIEQILLGNLIRPLRRLAKGRPAKRQPGGSLLQPEWAET